MQMHPDPNLQEMEHQCTVSEETGGSDVLYNGTNGTDKHFKLKW